MRRFSELYEALDSTSSTGAKVEAMAQYFRAAPAEDAAWAVFFLTGQRLKRLISGRMLRAWALRYTGLPEWLLADAHAAVGDSAETVTLLVQQGAVLEGEPLSLQRWLEERILPLRELPDEQQYAMIARWWRELSGRRIAASRGAGAGRGFRDAARHHRPSPGRQMAADGNLVPGVACRRARP
jgi:DNA ligase-1